MDNSPRIARATNMPAEYHEAKCPRCKKPFRCLVVTVLGQEAHRAKCCGECLVVEPDADADQRREDAPV